MHDLKNLNMKLNSLIRSKTGRGRLPIGCNECDLSDYDGLGGTFKSLERFFEPAAPTLQRRCSTGLSYEPIEDDVPIHADPSHDEAKPPPRADARFARSRATP
jgi:hypothetical protein